MKMPSKRFLFSVLYFGAFGFLINHYVIQSGYPEAATTPWFWQLGFWLLVGLFMAWATDGEEDTIARKNARWKARRQAEKE